MHMRGPDPNLTQPRRAGLGSRLRSAPRDMALPFFFVRLGAHESDASLVHTRRMARLSTGPHVCIDAQRCVALRVLQQYTTVRPEPPPSQSVPPALTATSRALSGVRMALRITSCSSLVHHAHDCRATAHSSAWFGPRRLLRLRVEVVVLTRGIVLDLGPRPRQLFSGRRGRLRRRRRP